MLNISKVFNSILDKCNTIPLSPIEEAFVKSVPTYGANVVMASLISLSFIKTALSKKTKNSLEHKIYLGAKVREKRYQNRYLVYKSRYDIVNLHSNIFTSFYNVYLHQKMISSSDSLLFAMNDIYTYEAFERLKNEK